MICDFVNDLFWGPFCLLVKSRRGGATAVVGVISRRKTVRGLRQERMCFWPKLSRELIIVRLNIRFIPNGHSSVPCLSERNERLICIGALGPDFLF